MNEEAAAYLEACASEREMHGAENIARNFRLAAAALRRYPLPVRTALEAQDVQHIGPKIAAMLAKNVFADMPGGNAPRAPSGGSAGVVRTVSAVAEEREMEAPKKKRVAKPREYVPKVGTGAAALLIVLLRQNAFDFASGMKKEELIELLREREVRDAGGD